MCWTSCFPPHPLPVGVLCSAPRSIRAWGGSGCKASARGRGRGGSNGGDCDKPGSCRRLLSEVELEQGGLGREKPWTASVGGTDLQSSPSTAAGTKAPRGYQHWLTSMTCGSVSFGPPTGWLHASNGWRREGLHTWRCWVRFLCGQFLSATKCDFRPARLQQYLGMVCDSDIATFRLPQDNLDKLQCCDLSACVFTQGG